MTAEGRADLLRAAAGTVTRRLNHSTTGNASVRSSRGFWITPSGFPLDGVGPDDLVHVSPRGKVLRGSRRPSSEWRLHRDIYRARKDVGAVVHAHPPFATTLACLRMDLPAVHYMVAAAGADRIRCAGYETFGTDALSAAALEALGASGACLLANHGLIAVGSDPLEALHRAEEVEACAEYYWRGLAIGHPSVLGEREMDAVLRQFRSKRRGG